MASPTTTNAILDTAERLFAERGFDAVSVREITREAGVNVAAVHYHFGSKDAVLRGVCDRVVDTINDRRRRLLAELLDETPVPPIVDVLGAFIRPDIEILQELHERGPTVAHFLGRLYLDQTPWIQEMAMEQFAPSSDAFAPVFGRVLGHLSPATIAIRMRRIGVVLAHAFAMWPITGLDDDEAGAMLEELVSFCSAALSADVEVAMRP